MKKVISILLALSIILSLGISSTTVSAEKILSADTDGVLWIEESDYDTYSNASDGVLSTRVGTSGTTQDLADSMSGKDAYWAWWGSATYSATYKINVSEGGTYKLWYRGSDPTGSYHDKIKITVNGEEVTVSKITGTDFTATIDPSGTKKNFACAWFVVEVSLVSGVNTIGYDVSEKSTSGQKYACLFDCMVVAPSAYEWSNPSVGTRPKISAISFDEDGVAWIEESDYDTYSNASEGVLSTRVGTNGTAQATADMMSGGDAYWAWWSGVTYTSSYKVNAPEAGTYKLWYRGSDPTGSYHNKSKIAVNGTEVTVSKITGTDFTATIDPSGTKKNYACAWFVVEVTLEKGVNTIEYNVTEKSTSGSKYACLFDCMVIAPAEYVWENPTIDTKPEVYVEPEIGIEFDEDGVCWIEESDFDEYSNASEGVLSTRVGTNGTAQATADMMSGGDAYWAWWGGVTYTSSYKVKAPEAGTYKLWYRGSDPSGSYHDKIKITVNGEEVTVSKIKGTDFTATIDPSGTRKNYACAWFMVEVTLEEGINTIGYNVTEKSTSGQKYACLFDCMVIAPAEYVWENPTIDTKPGVYVEPEIGIGFDEDGVCWIEESDYDEYSNASEGVLSTRVGTNGTQQSLADSMSGGDAYWAWWGGVTYTSSYKVKAPEAGTYKLWYRGSDPTGSYHDKIKMTVNGDEVTVSKVTGTDFTATIDPSGTKKNYACAWFMVEVTLEEGINTIGYNVTEKSTSGQKYACLFDCMVIAPANYEWDAPTVDTKPAKVVLKNYGWIEGENYTAVSGTSYFMARAFTEDNMSEGKALVLNTSTAPSGEAGYYADYTLKVGKDATYDIFVRSNHSSGSNSNSPFIISVDGTTYTHTELAFEGWIKPNSGSDQFTVGWSKITLTLTTGSHTLRWAVKEPGSSKYFGIVDAVVFMPSSMKFTPKTHDIIGTKAEYELSALLADYDLSKVTENISLPTETMSGKTVTWTTKDASSITNEGVVTRNEYYDKTVTLTASIAGNHKDFKVMVARNDKAYEIKNFKISGTLGNGNTITASASVTSLLNDRNMVIIIAHYDAENNIKGYDFSTYTLVKNSQTNASASIDLNNFASGDFIKAYIWNDLDNIDPITDSIEVR